MSPDDPKIAGKLSFLDRFFHCGSSWPWPWGWVADICSPALCRSSTDSIGNEEDTMEIKVLGPGCAKCLKLYEVTKKALEQSGFEATLTKVDKIDDIMTYGVVMTPALVIGEDVKSTGRLPKEAEIVSWITEAAGRK